MTKQINTVSGVERPGEIDVRGEVSMKNRRSIRLHGYDYSQAGAYFVNVCAKNRDCLFGDIVDGMMCLNDTGRIVLATWDGLASHYAGVQVDEFVVMPNHVHGIIIVGAGFKPAQEQFKPAQEQSSTNVQLINNSDIRAGFKPAPTGEIRYHGLSEIVRGLKTFSSRQINELHGTPGISVWQRNYYERIIRDEDELNRIRKYIINNPIKWKTDRENPIIRRGE